MRSFIDMWLIKIKQIFFIEYLNSLTVSLLLGEPLNKKISTQYCFNKYY